MTYYDYYAFIPSRDLANLLPSAPVSIVLEPQLWSVEKVDRVLVDSGPSLTELKKAFLWCFLGNLEMEAKELAIDVSAAEAISLEGFDRFWQIVYFRGEVSYEMVVKALGQSAQEGEG